MAMSEAKAPQPGLDSWGYDLQNQIADRLADYRWEVRRAGETILDQAHHRADVFEGKPVLRAPVTEAQIKTMASQARGEGLYRNVATAHTRGRDIVGLTRAMYRSDEDNRYDAIDRANKAIGGFFEIYSPPWDSRAVGRDVVFVFDVEKPEMPNPTVKFISIDPESKMFGIVEDIFATDIGFRPNPYNLIHGRCMAQRREDLGYVPTESDEVATKAIPGLAYLKDALANSESAQQPQGLARVALLYGADIRVGVID